MKKFTKLLTTALIVLAACTKIVIPSDSVPINNAGEYAIMFSNYPTTKAVVNSTSGTGYDAFSLFVWNSNNTLVMNPYTVLASGTDYVYDDVAGQKLEYFSRTANYYDFLGVIPTTHPMTLDADSVTVSSLVSFKVDDARVSGTLIADSPEEFLFASARVPKADYGNIVDLPFKHGNAVIYLGFSSDRTDTKLLDYAPGVAGTTKHFNIAGSYNATVGGFSISKTISQWSAIKGIINEVYELNEVWSNAVPTPNNNMGVSFTGIYELIIHEDKIPNGYAKEIAGVGKVFDTNKYLTAFCTASSATWEWLGSLLGYGTSDDWLFVHFDDNVNTTTGAYRVNLNPTAYFNNHYTDNNLGGKYLGLIEGSNPVAALEGIRVFSADSLGVNNVPTDTLYCVHRPHTTVADAVIKADTTVFKNRQTSKEVITYSLPATTTLSSTPVWSATTFYALPGDANLNWLVVKLSYIYNGITTYDVRVPIKLPDGGLKQGKYYKYEIHITSTSTGTNDPGEASDEKDEIIIEGLDPIRVQLSVTDYDKGADEKIII